MGKQAARRRLGVAELTGLIRSVAIYHGMPWRRRALRRFYSEFIKPGATVFDIGAHVGSRTRTLLSLGAHCIAVEPQPLFARVLARMFDNNARVSLIAQAVGREPGKARMQISSRHPTVSTLSAQWIDQVQDTQGFTHVQWDHTIDVPVTTLDILIDEYGVPDFCKIDVEGMESEILAGLSTPIPLVALEYIPAALNIAEECVAQLEALGNYVFNLSPGESHCFSLNKWVDATQIVEELTTAASHGRSGDLYARLLSSTARKHIHTRQATRQ
jgi:FkbM family methyltransferase